MGDISKNFSFYELMPHGISNYVYSDYQKYLLRCLIGEVQKVRDMLGVKLTVTSGVRLKEDYDRLKESGYNPSTTSDHYCGNAIKLDENNEKFKIFGEDFYMSVGAVDLVPESGSIYEGFLKVVDMSKRGKINIGQCIHEQSVRLDGTKKEWIHIGGDPRIAFTESVIKQFLIKTKYLTSNDNGKTYVPFV